MARTRTGAVKIAADMVEEGIITRADFVKRVSH